MSNGFTHFNAQGDAHMVDVGDKPTTRRRARAAGRILMDATTLAMIATGTHKKGDVLGIARIAGIMGAKRTADLIPLCHPLALTAVDLGLTLETTPAAVRCEAQVKQALKWKRCAPYKLPCSPFTTCAKRWTAAW